MTPDPQKLDALKEEVQVFLYDNQEFKITTRDEYTSAGDLLKEVQQRIKQLDEKRKSYTAPLDDLKKKIMVDFKKISDPLETFVVQVKTMMVTWYKVEQARLDAEQARIEAEALAQAKTEHKSEVVVPVVNTQVAQRGDYATISMRKIWTAEIEDETKIPREYLVPDITKINAAIRDGLRSLPGVKIYQKESPNIR